MGKFTAFLDFFIEQMIFQNSSSDNLKKLIDEKLSKIDTSEERIEILREIINIWQSRDIDRFYTGSIFDFKNYVEYLLTEETSDNFKVNKVKYLKVEPFEYLFSFGNNNQSGREAAEKVLKAFTENEYMSSGKWNYPGGGDYKTIATPFYILRDYFGIIIPGKQTGKLLKIWCSGLGIEVDRSFIRNCEKNPEEGKRPTLEYQRRRKEFYELFKPYFTPIKELMPLEVNKK